VYRHRRVLIASSLAALVVLGAATAGLLLRDNSSAATSPTPRATTPVASSPTTSTAPRAPITLAFAGDVHFEGVLRAKLDADPNIVLAPVALLLSSADLTVVNLETAITERGTPAAKTYVFRAPASALSALAGAGIDVANMANNHGLDYGPEGLTDSLAARDATGYPVIGIGHNATDAYKPFVTTIKGTKVAIIGATQVLDEALITSWTATDTQGGLASAKNVDRLVQEIRSARRGADVVVVFLHWGVEKQTCPSADQQALARALTNAGADVVVGSHSHRVEGGGRMGDAFVDYGLGNFAFYNDMGDNARTGVLVLTMTGRRVDSYQWLPARISGGVPQPLEGDAAASEVTAWDGLRACTGLTP